MYGLNSIIALSLLIPVLLSAQEPEEESLYIPPVLTVTNTNGGDPAVHITVEAFERTIPLLPMIFFDEPGGWTIPERFVQFRRAGEAHRYADTNLLFTIAMNFGKYYEVLNIVGYRMMKYPDAVVGLRGCFSGEPGENDTVARERAWRVREYLHYVWDIDTARLPILSSEPRAEAEDNVLMQEEARRMEFEADDSRIFQPVRHLEGEALGSGHPFGIVKSDVALSVTTNSSQEETAFLEFTLSTSSQSQTLYRTLRGSPDSSIYRINATLDLPLNTIRQEWGLQIEARVVNHHGESRASNRVKIPVTLAVNEKQLRWNRPPYITGGIISLFAPGDSTLSAVQLATLASVIARAQRPMLGISSPCSAKIYSSRIHPAELQTSSPLQINAEVAYDRRTRSPAEIMTERYTLNRRVEFHVPNAMEPAVDYRRRSILSPDYDEVKESNRSDSVYRSRLRNDAALLARGRIRAVEQYLRDSTDLCSKNVVNDASTSVNRSALPDDWPEERWYARTVYLSLRRLKPKE